MAKSNAIYQHTLKSLKEKIRQARLKAVLSVNAQMLFLYWEIGKVIAEQERIEGWGAKTVDRLSADLTNEFDDMRGLSPRNLRYMRDFYLAYPNLLFLQQDVAKKSDPEPKNLMRPNASPLKAQDIDNKEDINMQQAVAKLPWGHHILILTKVKAYKERAFYMQKCLENNWSRDMLTIQIENRLYQRQGASINNFKDILPAEHSDLANATFKNPYIFDFLRIGEKMQERDLELALIAHLKRFMLELGRDLPMSAINII